jgi:hypothetical protein
VTLVSATVAKWFSWFTFGFALIAMALATLYCFPWKMPAFRSAWFRYLLTATEASLFIYSLCNIAWGTTVRGLSSKLENWLREWLIRTTRRLFHIGDDGSLRSQEAPPPAAVGAMADKPAGEGVIKKGAG